MVAFILSLLIQYAVQVSSIVNPLECSGLVISWNDTGTNSTGPSEFAYAGGVCWASTESGGSYSFILQCDQADSNVIYVTQYEANEDCNADNNPNVWAETFPINCQSGSFCESFCPADGFDGCEYFIYKQYQNVSGCDSNQAPSNQAGLNYFAPVLVKDYCYAFPDTGNDEVEWAKGNFKFSQNVQDIVVVTYYTDSDCSTLDANNPPITVGANGDTSCEQKSDGTFDAYTVYSNTVSEEDLASPDLSITGQACVATGDPHFTTFNGVYHHFQGENDTQYYYIAPCYGNGYGYGPNSLPFRVLATHQEWTPGASVMAVEDLVLELYDSPTTQYLVFISPFRTPTASYVLDQNQGTKYSDTNVNDLSGLSDGQQIGNRFTFAQYGNIYAITFDSDCELKFKFDSRTVTILPPTCNRQNICGLCGEFNEAIDAHSFRTCDNAVVSYNSENFWEDRMAYDRGGNGWGKAYFDQHCDGVQRRRLQFQTTVYSETLPDNFTIVDPCDPSVASEAASSCAAAHAVHMACCDILQNNFCVNHEADCAFDVCVAVGTDSSLIDGFVQELFTDVVTSICAIPGIEDVMNPENLISVTTTTTTTTAEPTPVPTGNSTSPTPSPSRTTDSPTNRPTQPSRLPTVTPVEAAGVESGPGRRRVGGGMPNAWVWIVLCGSFVCIVLAAVIGMKSRDVDALTLFTMNMQRKEKGDSDEDCELVQDANNGRTTTTKLATNEGDIQWMYGSNNNNGTVSNQPKNSTIIYEN